MKKIICLMLAALLLISFAGCAKGTVQTTSEQETQQNEKGSAKQKSENSNLKTTESQETQNTKKGDTEANEKEEVKKSTATADITQEITKENEVTEQESYPFFQTDENTYVIKTKYCNLSYPKKWKDKCKVNTSENGSYKVSFSAKTESGNVPIFDFIFGESEKNKLGTLTVDGKEIAVYIESHTFGKSSMSEEEYSDCCAMSEDVNVVISKLIENYSFKLA